MPCYMETTPTTRMEDRPSCTEGERRDEEEVGKEGTETEYYTSLLIRKCYRIG